VSAPARILCVDDEPHVLEGLRRNLGLEFDVFTAPGGAPGLETMERDGPFAVVISDMKMPQMNGAVFLGEVHRRSPDTVRVLLTGHADVESAIAAVNAGQIFRFLTKPCPLEQLREVIAEAIAHHRLILAERDLLENTLRGSVRVLSQVLSLVNPTAFGRSSRLSQYVRHMAERLAVDHRWRFEMAALLSQLGCVVLPPQILSKMYAGLELSPEEAEQFASHPALAHELLAGIPRLSPVAEMIRRQLENGETGTPAAGGEEGDIALGAQMLRIALALDRQVVAGRSLKDAIAAVRVTRDRYDPRLLASLDDLQETAGGAMIRMVRARELTPFMTFDDDVHAKSGMLVVARGQEATAAVIRRLQDMAQDLSLVEPFRVVVRT
jgi:response regulator RpfG family c-di-GMP phosphodiesterase